MIYRHYRWIGSKYSGCSHEFKHGRRGQPGGAHDSLQRPSPCRLKGHPMKLLHLDSSILGGNSVSRALSAAIVAREAALHPGLEIIYRDLAVDEVRQLSGGHVAARFGAAVDDAALRDDLAKGDVY